MSDSSNSPAGDGLPPLPSSQRPSSRQPHTHGPGASSSADSADDSSTGHVTQDSSVPYLSATSSLDGPLMRAGQSARVPTAITETRTPGCLAGSAAAGGDETPEDHRPLVLPHTARRVKRSLNTLEHPSTMACESESPYTASTPLSLPNTKGRRGSSTALSATAALPAQLTSTNTADGSLALRSAAATGGDDPSSCAAGAAPTVLTLPLPPPVPPRQRLFSLTVKPSSTNHHDSTSTALPNDSASSDDDSMASSGGSDSTRVAMATPSPVEGLSTLRTQSPVRTAPRARERPLTKRGARGHSHTSTATMLGAAVLFPTSYATYNVHPVLNRADHPFFQREVSGKIGRQVLLGGVGNSTVLHPSANNTSSPFLPLSVSPMQGSSSSAAMAIESAPLSRPSSSASAAGNAAPPRKGFNQSLLTPPRHTGADGGGDQAGTGSSRTGRTYRLVSTNSDGSGGVKSIAPDSLDPLSGTQSLVDVAGALSHDHYECPPSVLETCPNPSLRTTVPAAPQLTGWSLALRPSLSLLPPQGSATLSPLHSPTGSLRRATPQLPFHSSPPQLLWTGRRMSLLSGQAAAPPQDEQTQQHPLPAPSPPPRHVPAAVAPAPLMWQPRYDRRDIRRGRWQVDLLRAEVEGRARIEEAECYEAIRTLPASCGVWRSYMDPALDEELDLLACCSAAYTVDDDNGSGAAAKGDGEMDEDEDDVAWRERLAMAAAAAMVARKRSETPALHPALRTAMQRLELLEEVCRGHIVQHEDGDFQRLVYRPYAYEHRVMTVGTLPLERFLRWWISVFRARKILRLRQLERLCLAEAAARRGLVATSRDLHHRYELMKAALVAEEGFFRTTLERMYVQDAAMASVVLLRLQEHVELFTVLFGGTMRKTRVCARVEGTTLFRALVLAEEARRAALGAEEDARRREIPVTLHMELLVVLQEPRQRAAIARAEAVQREELARMVFALCVHYTRRDVETQDADARQLWHYEMTASLFHRGEGTRRIMEDAVSPLSQ